MRLLLVILLTFLGTFGILAQNDYLKDISETQELSKKIVSLFNENKISESFEELAIYWPLPENEILSLKTETIKYLNIIQDRFGGTIGTLKVDNETITNVATRETYLIRYKKVP